MDGHYSCRTSFAKMHSMDRDAHESLIAAGPSSQSGPSCLAISDERFFHISLP
jgi:hypothetical protein